MSPPAQASAQSPCGTTGETALGAACREASTARPTMPTSAPPVAIAAVERPRVPDVG